MFYVHLHVFYAFLTSLFFLVMFSYFQAMRFVWFFFSFFKLLQIYKKDFLSMFIFKRNPCISGSVKLKPVLFKGLCVSLPILFPLKWLSCDAYRWGDDNHPICYSYAFRFRFSLSTWEVRGCLTLGYVAEASVCQSWERGLWSQAAKVCPGFATDQLHGCGPADLTVP